MTLDQIWVLSCDAEQLKQSKFVKVSSPEELAKLGIVDNAPDDAPSIWDIFRPRDETKKTKSDKRRQALAQIEAARNGN